MLETLVMFAMLALLTACLFPPVSSFNLTPVKNFLSGKVSKTSSRQPLIARKVMQQVSNSGNDFLDQLQSKVESELAPRPSDSVLRRHHDALIASELQNRLAKMPRT